MRGVLEAIGMSITAAGGPHTKIEEEMENKLAQLSPDSTRYRALLCAKKFKSNWLELGQHLHRISKNKEFEKWGFGGFEKYCVKELRIRFETAMKLVASVGYLEKHQPALLEDFQKNPALALPDYRSLDRLAQAEKEGDIPEEDVRELRQQVLAAKVGPVAVQKQLRVLRDEDLGALERQRRIERLGEAVAVLSRLLPDFEPDDATNRAFSVVEAYILELQDVKQAA